MFGLKSLRARLERIEGSLLWIARELSGPNGLEAWVRELSGVSAGLATLREEVGSLSQSVARKESGVSAGLATLREEVGSLAQSVARKEQVTAAQLDRTAAILGQLHTLLAQELSRNERAIERVYQVLAGLEGTEALREQLATRSRELEAVGEQALRIVEVLHETRRRLALREPAGDS